MRTFLARAALIITLLGGGVYAHAQMTTVDPLILSPDPLYPVPYSYVSITPQSNVIDLASSNLTFSVNGVVVQKSTGGTPVTVRIGGPGETTSVTVTASLGGKVYTKKLDFHPAAVALITEPLSTTHPFYKGGAQLASQGLLRLVAVPDFRTANGTQINPQSLVYTWKNGDQILQDSSGLGRSVLVAAAPVRYRDTTIVLTVSTPDQSTVAQSQTAISPVDPEVRVYQTDPLLGPLYNQALADTVSITGSEKSFRAVPYYFAEVPSLSWVVNGEASQQGQDITLRPAGSGAGTAQVSVTAKSASYPQDALAELSILFGNAKPTGIFGL